MRRAATHVGGTIVVVFGVLALVLAFEYCGHRVSGLPTPPWSGVF